MTNDEDREKIRVLRETTDLLVEGFGDVYVGTEFDEDKALIALANMVGRNRELSKAELSAMIAFMARRLWHHRRRLARSFN